MHIKRFAKFAFVLAIVALAVGPFRLRKDDDNGTG